MEQKRKEIGRRRREKKEMRRGVRICFWNIAGGLNKCEETWKYLERFDIIGLTETWIEEKKWKKMESNLSKKYEWECIPAIKEKKEGKG